MPQLTVAEIMQLHDAGFGDDFIEKLMNPAPAPQQEPVPAPTPKETEVPEEEQQTAADILNSVLNS